MPRFTPGELKVMRLLWEHGELKHLLWQARRRHARAALSIARPRRHVVHAYFQPRDPGPLFAHAFELACRPRRGVRTSPPGS